MIVDTLTQRDRYRHLHPGFAAAFDFAASHELAALAAGRHHIDGDRVFVSIDHTEGRGRAAARLESHRRYIDIQLTIDGAEEIGWRPLAQCRAAIAPFDEQRDIGFYGDAPDSWVAVPPGRFAIFFPEDAHAPLAGTGRLKKAIFKIACGFTAD
jgi:YhcH/YjgK/YiaL family protein